MGGELTGSSARKLPLADCRCYVRNTRPRSHLRCNDPQTAADTCQVSGSRMLATDARLCAVPAVLDNIFSLGRSTRSVVLYRNQRITGLRS